MPEIPARPPDALTPLLREDGASWYWVLLGPATAGAMAFIQHSSGYGWQPLIPAVFLVLVSGFLAVQIKAARVHTSVELTEQTLRQGTETLRVADIVRVYPEPDRRAENPEKWQEARTLGEINGVPRGRFGVGLRLTGGRDAQAWARHHRALRAALISLVAERAEPLEPDLDGDDIAESPW